MLRTDEELDMKRFRDLTVCIERLRDVQNRDGVQPEQVRKVARSIELVKELARIENPTRQQVRHYVREITENLADAFLKA